MRRPLSSFQFFITLMLPVSALIVTELGLRWWFAIHERVPAQVAGWTMRFGAGAVTKPLVISKEVRALLQFDQGTGWQWEGGGGERWQAFLFAWNRPKSLAQRIISTEASSSHQPETCFTAAGMQLRQTGGQKLYVVNGVPLVFKVYEFADRNVPIFVFACTWKRNAGSASFGEEQLAGEPSTTRGFHQAIRQLIEGRRGITDEVRVVKFGVWGLRTIEEAETSFQQQLNHLVQPAQIALTAAPSRI